MRRVASSFMPRRAASADDRDVEPFCQVDGAPTCAAAGKAGAVAVDVGEDSERSVQSVDFRYEYLCQALSGA